MQVHPHKKFIFFCNATSFHLRIIKIKKGVNPLGFPIFARIECILSKPI